MDRLLREERVLTANMVKKIAETGCNVLLIQKSILRDAVTDLSLAFLARKGILTVRDIEREDIEFISQVCSIYLCLVSSFMFARVQTLNCTPIASLDHFTTDRLGSAKLVQDESCSSGGRITRITGVPGKSTVTILCRASNAIVCQYATRRLLNSFFEDT
jgi:T-complex protein 1 subunit delta